MLGVKLVFVDLKEANTAVVVVTVATECVSTDALALDADHSEHFVCFNNFV